MDASRLALLSDELAAPPEQVAAADRYLSYFGYLSLQPAGVMAVNQHAHAVATFQAFAGLTPTGKLDQQTVAKMQEPRCGCADVQRVGALEARWRKKRLTYWVGAFVGGIPQDEQEELIRLAWGDWEAAADVTLEQVSSRAQADIIIATGSGPQQGFDGPSGTLAWAQLPSGNDGQLLMRFDLSETWLSRPGMAGIVLRNVACHEFGHLLGLDHSRNPAALMAPFYSARVASPQPHDDIPRIQALYGPPSASPAPAPQPSPKPGGFKMELRAAAHKVLDWLTSQLKDAASKTPQFWDDAAMNVFDRFDNQLLDLILDRIVGQLQAHGLPVEVREAMAVLQAHKGA